jgi:hypothetical protein
MIVIVSGCKDSTLREEVLQACHFYAEQLLSKQMLRNIVIEIDFVKQMENLGDCMVSYYNDWYKAREFEIRIKKSRSIKNMLCTLAHEMVHVKQFAKGELNCDQTRWQKQDVDSDNVEYSELPWEVEASTLERMLYHMYIEQKQ